MSDDSVLRVRELAVNYKTRKGVINAVRDVSFDIRQGENLGLVGESGCGKSTVAFAIVNFLGQNGEIAHGSIQFKGEELVGRTEKELRSLRGSDIAMVYQEPMSSLNPSLRIFDQLAEAVTAHQGLSRQEARLACAAVLQRVNMPDIERVLASFPHQLSGGQQQRVLIAMAMLNNPALLIMDEPTTALDVTVEAAVLDLIAELEEEHKTATLYISHNLGVVARVADRVAVMYAGEIVEQASTRGIFQAALHPYTVGLMRCLPDVDAPRGTRTLHPIRGQVPPPTQIPAGCIFAPRCDYCEPTCEAERPRLRDVAAGHLVRCRRAEEFTLRPPWSDSIAMQPEKLSDLAGEPPDGLLEISHLKVYYSPDDRSLLSLLRPKRRKKVRAVDDINLAVPAAQTVGVVGESGCGKSTLARAIVGLEPISGGRIEFATFDVSEPLRQRDRATIRELQMVFQNPDSVLNPTYTVGNQIAASLRRFKVVPPSQVYGEVVRLLNAVKLDESYYPRFPRQLSGGEKQRAGIARAIAAKPSILVCDEPVSSLDVSVQASIIMLLAELQALNRTAMILISHDLSTVRFLSHFVVVMYMGQIVEAGSSEAIYSPPYHPYTAALLAAVPRPDPHLERAGFRLEGPVPSAIDPPAGCRFHTRCPLKLGEICVSQPPPRRDMGEGHHIYCHLPLDRLPDSWTVTHSEPCAGETRRALQP